MLQEIRNQFKRLIWNSSWHETMGRIRKRTHVSSWPSSFSIWPWKYSFLSFLKASLKCTFLLLQGPAGHQGAVGSPALQAPEYVQEKDIGSSMFKIFALQGSILPLWCHDHFLGDLLDPVGPWQGWDKWTPWSHWPPGPSSATGERGSEVRHYFL